MDEGALDPSHRETSNRMKQIAIALHNYHETHQRLPPQAIVDAEGRKLLSWRVLILPFLGQQALYNQFHLDESWDSPHNLEVAQSIPHQYAPTNQSEIRRGDTRVLAPLTAESAFGRPGLPLTFRDVTDGLSNTIWFVQGPASAAVPWSKPADWEIDANSYEKWLPTPDASASVCNMDGSVQSISGAVAWETLSKWLTISGREIVAEDELHPEE